MESTQLFINGVINSTYDYSRFSLFNWNREVINAHVKFFMDEIKKYGWNNSQRILVDNQYRIYDGQHRFYACVNLQLPIFYEVCNMTEDQVKRLNNSKFKWTLEDYVFSNKNKGIKRYNDILIIKNELKINVSSSIAIVPNIHLSPEKIRSGKPFELFEKLDILIEFLIDIKPFIPYWDTTAFIRALKILITNVNNDQINKVKKYIVSVPQQVGTTEYLVAFENILNRYKKINPISLFNRNTNVNNY